MNTLREILPKEAVDVIQMVHEEGCKLYQQASQHYMVLNNQMKKCVEENLPENLQLLSMKVIDSLPETLFSLSIVTDTGRGLAMINWAIRAAQILSPLVPPVLNGKIEKETLDAAGQEVLGNINETVERFKPAVFLSCSVAAVFHGVIGVLTLNVNNLFEGSLYALAATMAYQSMDLKQKEASLSSPAPDRTASDSRDAAKVT